MVFGFPGRTTQYLHSSAVDQIMKVNDPAKIAIRDKALSVMDNFMRKDEQVKIMYAAKYASVQNAYKKWQGEVLGLTRTDGVGKKKIYENEFQKRVNANPQWKTNYGNLLPELEMAYADMRSPGFARDYYIEITGRVELLTIASQLNSLITAYEKDGEKGFAQRLPTVKNILTDLLGEFSPVVDQQLFEVLMEMYVKDQEEKYVSPLFKESLAANEGSYKKLAAKLYSEKELYTTSELMKLLDKPAAALTADLKERLLLKLYNNILKTYQTQVQGPVNEVQARINKLQRTYMQAQMDVMKERKFYPDANSTLRVTYGNVKGYNARDAVKYDFYTYLDGVMDKYKPGDYEFDVPEKLRTLYTNKDFGPYGSKGKMPVCFIAMNHTTGGNSGSPALDAYGNLIGLNFDRVWEGTMSDINYDPSICRNIMVDIRYVLFVVDKYAGAGHLVKEMKLVHPKAKK